MHNLGSYGILTLSTIMFGLMFFFNDIFRKNYGSDLKATLIMNLGGGVFGFVALVLINGLKFEFTLFAFIMAVILSVNGLLFSFCSLKALDKINLSLYSLFSMLGGMALPFISGILFHEEGLTIGKTICFIIISAALCLTIKKDKGKSGTVYYIGIFVFNGMSGVISKAYQALSFEKISSAGYSALCALVAIILSLALLPIIKGEKRKINFPCIFAMAGYGFFRKGCKLAFACCSFNPARIGTVSLRYRRYNDRLHRYQLIRKKQTRQKGNCRRYISLYRNIAPCFAAYGRNLQNRLVRSKSK